jgi:hypothetical protein
MKRRRLDPLWVAERDWARALVAAVYVVAFLAFLLIVKDDKYALLWWSLGLLGVCAFHQLWWEWTRRELDRRSENENV